MIFGSNSNSNVYIPLIEKLKSFKVSVDLRICSAHRTPKDLERIIGDYERRGGRLIVTGAGLSAALPGVSASLTILPVIGVPCKDNYEGLDALLSIMQMPPGIPVLGTGVGENSIPEIVEECVLALREKKGIVLVKKIFETGEKQNEFLKCYEKAKKTLDLFDVNYEEEEEGQEEIQYSVDNVYIDFIPLKEIKNANGRNHIASIIFVPFGKAKAEDASELLNVKKDLWVGLNRGDNAAFAAMQLLATNKRFSSLKTELINYRKEMAEKVRKKNKEEREKLKEENLL